ncbi:MAG TPA: hypothetical protein VGX69_06030 [Solirubrobacteraceae bacterium]|jgi:hypothetical protein|nr:hypothetical protein [Solirubrobacteraceae bacterium]
MHPIPGAAIRSAVIIASVAVSFASATGCGGGASDQTVAEVGSSVITKAMFDHWLHVAAVRNYRLHPVAPVPKGVVPDPPHYTQCVAYLKTLPPRSYHALPSIRPGTTFQAQCKELYDQLRVQTMSGLITAYWLIGEGRAHGFVASKSAVKQYYERSWKGGYANKAEFEKSLANSGETVADQLFRAEVKVYSGLIENQYVRKGATRLSNPALARFLTEFPARWAARTSCRKGYVVPNCRQAGGKPPPEAVLM